MGMSQRFFGSAPGQLAARAANAPTLNPGERVGMATHRAGGIENMNGKIAAAMLDQGYQFPQGPTAYGGYAPDYAQAMQGQGMRSPITSMQHGVTSGLTPLEMAQRYAGHAAAYGLNPFSPQGRAVMEQVAQRAKNPTQWL